MREEAWEFNAPKYYNFRRISETEASDRWFESEEAAHLESGIPNKKSSKLVSPKFTPVRTPKKRKKSIAKQNAAAIRLKLTIPTTPKFKTDERARKNIPEIIEEEIVKPKQGQKLTQTKTKWQPKITQPVPFVFHESCRKCVEYTTSRSPFVKSFAEKAKEFNESRFKRVPEKASPFKPKLTVPKEFNLLTSSRVKPVKILSTEERELLEIENASKSKAKPFNIKMLNSDANENKDSLKQTAPKLQVEKKAKENAKKRGRQVEEKENSEEPPPKVFKTDLIAQNKKTERSVSFEKKITIPKSPFLATKARHRPVVIPPPEPIPVFKARPMPDNSPFKPKLGDAPLTEPSPFDLKTEIRGQIYVESLKEKLEREAKEQLEKRQFRAHPIVFEPTKGLAKVEKLPITEPKPFQLPGESNFIIAQERLQRMIEEREEKRKAAALFKARPMPDTKPFIPQKSNAPLTEPTDKILNSDKRAEVRKRFDELLRQKEIKLEKERKLLEEERRRQEELEIAKLRKEMEVKARPMPDFYNVAPKIKTKSSQNKSNSKKQ